jgi:tRNA(adenine34) deaminase
VVTDADFMAIALGEADLAAREGEIPIGCIIKGRDGVELARAHNLREQLMDVTAHAEVVALRLAARVTRSWRCVGATVYVTLEPCVMCASALQQARIARLVYACDDPKAGGVVSLYAIGQDPRLNHQFELTRGVMEQEAAARLQEFFARLRREGKK